MYHTLHDILKILIDIISLISYDYLGKLINILQLSRRPKYTPIYMYDSNYTICFKFNEKYTNWGDEKYSVNMVTQ